MEQILRFRPAFVAAYVNSAAFGRLVFLNNLRERRELSLAEFCLIAPTDDLASVAHLCDFGRRREKESHRVGLSRGILRKPDNQLARIRLEVKDQVRLTLLSLPDIVEDPAIDAVDKK